MTFRRLDCPFRATFLRAHGTAPGTRHSPGHAAKEIHE
jgi:hypothetical protein